MAIFTIFSCCRYGALSPITFLDGIQLFGGPGIASTSTRGDFENYIARLHAVQRQVQSDFYPI